MQDPHKMPIEVESPHKKEWQRGPQLVRHQNEVVRRMPAAALSLPQLQWVPPEGWVDEDRD